MKATYRTANGRLSFEITGETPKDLFAGVAGLQEVFEAESACGCCNGTDLRFLVRRVDGKYTYYELACRDLKCRARFAFGQLAEGGGLFPKRKDAEGEWLPNRGWARYVPKEGGKAPARQQPPDGAEFDEDIPF